MPLKECRALVTQMDMRVEHGFFPSNASSFKYGALFDERSVFDALRAAFMVHADPKSSAVLFLTNLQSVCGINDFPLLREAVAQWTQCTHADEPPLFARRAWTAYLRSIEDGSYYFSIDELIAMCCAAPVRVA
eukprot:10876151-Karenia_brevis.AAC.1